MTPEQYAAIRQVHGSQRAVALRLGVSHITLARRETGKLPISREAELAIKSLPKKKP
jgi:DNA-binding transcriptional regulator YdaS (Cro superfamily)